MKGKNSSAPAIQLPPHCCKLILCEVQRQRTERNKKGGKEGKERSQRDSKEQTKIAEKEEKQKPNKVKQRQTPVSHSRLFVTLSSIQTSTHLPSYRCSNTALSVPIDMPMWQLSADLAPSLTLTFTSHKRSGVHWFHHLAGFLCGTGCYGG